MIQTKTTTRTTIRAMLLSFQLRAVVEQTVKCEKLKQIIDERVRTKDLDSFAVWGMKDEEAIHMFDGLLSESQVSGLLPPDDSEEKPLPVSEAGEVVETSPELTTLAQLGHLKAILLEEYIDAVCETLPARPLHAILSGSVNPAPPFKQVSADQLERAILRLHVERESRQDYTGS